MMNIRKFFKVRNYYLLLGVIMHVIWTKTHRKELQTKLREAS